MKKMKLDTFSKVESSNVELVGLKDNDLYVQFKNGGLYKYKNADSNTYNNLCKAESIGKFLNQKVKPEYEFEKIENTKIQTEREVAYADLVLERVRLLDQISKLKQENEDLTKLLKLHMSKENKDGNHSSEAE